MCIYIYIYISILHWLYHVLSILFHANFTEIHQLQHQRQALQQFQRSAPVASVDGTAEGHQIDGRGDSQKI